MAGVAQSVRARGCGPRGRGFDSRRSPHFLKVTLKIAYKTKTFFPW